MSRKYKLGVVLSGGGSRGFAHLGVLKALAEKGLVPDVYLGVSAGALTGAFLATGKSIAETYEILGRKGLFAYTRIKVPNLGFLSLAGLEKMLKQEFGGLDLAETNLRVGVTNINKPDFEVISEGSMVDYVMASVSLPILFEPVEINGVQYIDGGVMNNMPVKYLLDDCEQVIAVNVNGVGETGKVRTMVEMANRAYLAHYSYNESLDNPRVRLIEPPGLVKYNILDVRPSQEIFDLGYDYAKSLDWL